MSFKQKIKIALISGFAIMAVRQYLLFGDIWGSIFLFLILLSLVLSPD